MGSDNANIVGGMDELRHKLLKVSDDNLTDKAPTLTGSPPKESVSNKDIIELMLDNLSEIRRYYSISKSQSRASFSLAVAAAAFGVILLGASVLIIFINGDSDSAILPAVCGAVTQIFAGTALIVHKSAISQLNRYYEALHKNEQFLSAVYLIGKLSPDKQDEAYGEVIKNLLEMLREDKPETNTAPPKE